MIRLRFERKAKLVALQNTMMRKSRKDSLSWATSSFAVFFLLFVGQAYGNKEGYFGKYVGKLSQLHHGVSGDVFAVDARTLHIRNFNYDGEGPAAYFYAGSSKGPGVNGFRLRDERGTTNVLPRYRNKHITVTLPEGKTLQNIRWFSVWCDEFSVNFGDVKIPKNLDFPKPQKISGLSGVHGVSSEPIVIVDAQTLLIPSFSYDGEAPDAKFWVGRGFKPSPQGIRIPDENGKELPLRRYDRKTIVLTLPGDLTIFDIGHFGVWCEAFTVDFGHVQIPRGLNIPPSLKMLGVSPQSKLNCEVLWDDFAYEVRWAVAGDSIVLQLVARLENNEYMSFGMSGDDGRSRMVGGDVVVAWVDKESLKGFAKDYYLDAKSQCSGGRGSCPDENIQAGADSVRLLNAALVNGYSIVTFQRSLKAQDDLDKDVFTNTSQPVIWAIGPLNSRKEVSYHSLANRGDIFIDFGRAPKWNCPTPESVSEESDSQDSSLNREYEEARIPATATQDSSRRESRPKTQIPTPAPAPKVGAWEIPPIKCYEPEDGVFYAQMGPTGGKHGYSAITGHVGWGISWYINGLLIPEINVVRGRTYTFIVEGGLDPETPARYHPFYITDDPVGGYQHKTPEERANIQIFAGAVQNKRGEVRPTGVGRLCNWTPDPSAPPADEFTSFGAYQRTLRLECDPGNPGIIQWTVEKDTPDTVYYQCYTHRYLGWKIRVHDDCEGAAASDPVPSVLKAPADVVESYERDLEGSESIYHETRIKPDAEFSKTVLARNKTNFGANEFVSFGSRPDISEFTQNNVKDLKIEFGLKTSTAKHQIASQGSTAGSMPQELMLNVPQTSVVPDNKLLSFSTVTLPSKSSGYSVSEEPLEGNGHPNFHIIPVFLPQEESVTSFPIHQKLYQQEPVYIPPRTTAGNKFREGYTSDPGILRAQPEEKVKRNNYKQLHNGKQSNRIPGGLNRLRKPSRSNGIQVQSQVLPSVGFPPQTNSIKIHKRPIHKIQYQVPAMLSPPQHRINVALHPESYHKQETRLVQQMKPPVRKQQSSSFNPFDLVGSSSANEAFIQNMPFAHNRGFDPESVQVEGGFKPILNTGIASKVTPDSIDRTALKVAEEADDRIGVVDLVTGGDTDAKSSERSVNEGPHDGKRVNKGGEDEEKKIDFFKNQEPQMFEPIFIPSHPDNSLKKNPEKHKKKLLMRLKPRSDQFERFVSQKEEDIYVKIRPSANLIQRPLYPDNIVPPFHSSSSHHGEMPQLRSHLSEKAENGSMKNEEKNMAKNDVSNKNIRAENIMEVLEIFESEGKKTTGGKASTAEENPTNGEVPQDEIAVADERKDFYLPPRAEEFLSYDGKLVRTIEAPTLAEANPPDISKLPQFAPFKGATPPLSQVVNAKNLPQLRTSILARQDILPPSNSGSEGTALKVPSNLRGDQEHERTKRSPDHIPGHEGHDHDHHDHHHHTGGSSRVCCSLLQIVLVGLGALNLHKLI